MGHSILDAKCGVRRRTEKIILSLVKVVEVHLTPRAKDRTIIRTVCL